MSSAPPTNRPSKPTGISPKKKAALRWLLALLAVALGIFVFAVPASHRIRVVVAFAIVTPWAIFTLFYVLRDE